MKRTAAILLLCGASCATRPPASNPVERATAPASPIVVTWNVIPPAQITGLEQRQSLTGPWSRVTEFPVAAGTNVQTFAVAVAPTNTTFWRAYTR